MSRILVVEDETKLAAAIAEGLEGNGYHATVAHSGETGLKHLESSGFDVIVLDLMLPGCSGLETLREARKSGIRTPVLILTAKSTVDDRVRGLDAGADDYLVKPFAFAELVARVRALQRRVNPEVASVIEIADLKMELAAHRVTRAGEPIELTAREFEVLEYLLLNRGTVVSRELLTRDVWKTTMRYSTLDNVIDVHIARIRRKIDDGFETKLLHTVRGVGFVLRSNEEA